MLPALAVVVLAVTSSLEEALQASIWEGVLVGHSSRGWDSSRARFEGRAGEMSRTDG